MKYDLIKFQLFHGLNASHMDELGEEMEVREYKKDDIVIQENTSGNELYILLSGMVVIQKALTLTSDTSEMEKNKALIHLKSEWYPFFGEFAIIEENAIRTASVIAETDCVMGVFTREKLMNYMNTHPKCGYNIFQNISRVLGDRLKKTNHDILKLTTALMLILED